MLSLELEKSYAVLIGINNFPRDTSNLPALPAVEENIKALVETFSDLSIIGIPKENIVPITGGTRDDILEKLAEVGDKVEDTFIVYYAGHGLISPASSKFYLATEKSRSKDLEFNSILFEDVRNAIIQSIAKRKILILDCCFSGRALEMMGTESSLLQANIDLKGTFSMASSPPNEPSKAPEGEKYTAFSDKFIHTLKNGLDNKKDGISLEEIYENIRVELHRENLPLPQRKNFQDADKIIFAMNKKYDTSLEDKLNEKISAITVRLDKAEQSISQLEAEFKKFKKSKPREASIKPLDKRKIESVSSETFIKFWIFIFLAFIPSFAIWFIHYNWSGQIYDNGFFLFIYTMIFFLYMMFDLWCLFTLNRNRRKFKLIEEGRLVKFSKNEIIFIKIFGEKNIQYAFLMSNLGILFSVVLYIYFFIKFS